MERNTAIRGLPLRWVVFLLAGTGLLAAAAAQAGAIFIPGRLEDGKFVPDESVKAPCYVIRYGTIEATVDGDLAKTRIVETVAGPDERVRTVCLIPLPAAARDAVVLAAGADGERSPVPGAEYLAPAAAQRVYEAIARGGESVKVLALSGRPAMLVPRLDLKGKIDVIVEFRQRLREREGIRSLLIPVPMTKWAAGPVARLSLTATVRSAEPLRAMFSPTHDVSIERKGDREAVVRVRADDFSGADDFRLCYVADASGLGLRVLAYRPEGDDDGYFMVVGRPGGGEKAIDKDVVFVLDTSGSMRGGKIEQARAAIDYCLDRLNPRDRFNIITFGTEVVSFRDGLVAKSPRGLADAREFVEGLVARGRTNIGGALTRALGGARGKDRPQIMIFLTDGTPTAGELVPDKIVEGVRRANAAGVRIFVMGVGHDVNAHLLDKLAEAADGSSEYVEPKEDIDVKMAALYDRLSHPVLTNVTVAFGDLRTHSVYPQKLPALFKGSEVMIFGRYRDGGEHAVTISGELSGEPASYVCKAEFPRAAAGGANEFVSPLWAARKIGHLLQEIRLHGQNKELIEEVVRLSTKFGIVTEYTNFLASGDTAVSGKAALTEASRRMEVANCQQAGQWAFHQARNDRKLQHRLVAGDQGNVYVDRRGRQVANDNVRRIGRRVFYLRDGQWADAEEPGERKTRVVKLFSPEYMKLLRSDRDFARAQTLAWAVAMNVGKERIVVEKGGKQKIEALRNRQEAPPQGGADQMQQAPRNQQIQNIRRIKQVKWNQLPQAGRRQLPGAPKPAVKDGDDQKAKEAQK